MYMYVEAIRVSRVEGIRITSEALQVYMLKCSALILGLLFLELVLFLMGLTLWFVSKVKDRHCNNATFDIASVFKHRYRQHCTAL